MNEIKAVAVLVLAAPLAAGCGYFGTRIAEPPPPTTEVCRTSRTLAESLFTDLKCALEAPNTAGLQNYREILDDNFVFQMDPTDALESGLGDTTVTWDKTADVAYTGNALSNAESLVVTYTGLLGPPPGSTEEHWVASYNIRYVPFGSPAQLYAGQADIDLSLGLETGKWAFTRWADHRDTSGLAAFGRLKRR